MLRNIRARHERKRIEKALDKQRVAHIEERMCAKRLPGESVPEFCARAATEKNITEVYGITRNAGESLTELVARASGISHEQARLFIEMVRRDCENKLAWAQIDPASYHEFCEKFGLENKAFK